MSNAAASLAFFFFFSFPPQNLFQRICPVIDSITSQTSLLRSGGYRAARSFAPVRGFVPARAPSLRSILPQLVAGLGKQVVTLVTIRPTACNGDITKGISATRRDGSPLTTAAREVARRIRYHKVLRSLSMSNAAASLAFFFN